MALLFVSSISGRLVNAETNNASLKCEEEVLRCKVVGENGEKLATCWFCNCDDLAHEVSLWYPYM